MVDLIKIKGLIKRWLKTNALKFALALASVLFVVVVVELFLSVSGYPRLYGIFSIAIEEVQRGAYAKWWIYDEQVGLKFDKTLITDEILKKAISISPNWKRLKTVNKCGYHDKDEFATSEAEKENLRILILGDSFAWGASADIGKSFVEKFEQLLCCHRKNVLVWNTSIPGTGTQQQLLVLKKYAKIMNPHYVILCFYENDIMDSLYPLDRMIRTESGIGINPFRIERPEGKCKKLTTEEIIAKLARAKRGRYPNIFSKTRLGYIIQNNLKKRPNRKMSSNLINEAVRRTKHLVKAIHRYCRDHGHQLMVLVIPSRYDIEMEDNRKEHEIIKAILKQDRIPFIDPLELLEASDYRSLPDDHWDNSGHAKIGQLLYESFIKIDRELKEHQANNVDMIEANIKDLGLPTKSTSLIGHWALNENDSSAIMKDSSFNAHHGSSHQNTNGFKARGANGDPNGAKVFNGTSDYVDLTGIGLDLDVKKISISIWAKPDDVTAPFNWILGNGAQFRIGFIRNGVCFWIREREYGPSNQIIGGKINMGMWHHIVGTYDGNCQKLYLDGTLVTSEQVVVDISKGQDNFAIGKPYKTSSQHFKGEIDDVKIFNEVLSHRQIIECYVEGL